MVSEAGQGKAGRGVCCWERKEGGDFQAKQKADLWGWGVVFLVRKGKSAGRGVERSKGLGGKEKARHWWS